LLYIFVSLAILFKNELYALLVMGLNSELEGVEENSVSPDMDVRLAFAVQDVPSEALAFSNKAEAGFKRS